jgi:outer membrane protein assembly factor BamA
MPGNRKYCLWLSLALACCHCAFAQVSGIEDKLFTIPPADSATAAPHTFVQPDARFIVRNIIIKGNRKTRPEIILREIPFRPGESFLLQVLVTKFEEARRQIMNTSLFHEVSVTLKSFDGYNIDILVQVRERWYLFPVPYVKPVDRNLNQWIIEQKGSLDRVNYGAKLLYNNVTGRNDKLRATFITGYTKQLSISYDRQYIDKAMRWGLSLGFALGKNKEINYNTINDKQVFLKQDAYLRNFMGFSAELTYRRAIKTRHRFGFIYTREEIGDTIVKLNPTYFAMSQKRISFPEIFYRMTYLDLDYNPYPTKGYAAEIFIGKKGFNKSVNLLQISASGTGIWPTGKKSFFTTIAYGAIKLPFKQPYFTQHMLGFSDVYLQGYEYYVIDGVAAGYLKAAFNKKLFNFSITIPGGKKREPLKIPFNFYGKVYGNTGYVHNPQPGDNSLSNKMLYSAGLGIDVITFYDFVLKFEWSFNQLGQNDIFLHRKSIF